MRRGVATAAALAVVTAALAVLTRPLLHSFRADKVTVELGILPAPSERARIVDEHVLHAVEAHSFGPELRLRLDRPPRTVRLDSFEIDRCEVRQIDFERFSKWYREEEGRTGKRPEPAPDPIPDSGTAPETARNVSGRRPAAPVSASTGHRVAGLLGSPATGVDFSGAALYCEAVGGRLPWAEELEAAAAGREGRLYAWGDEFDPDAWPYLDAYRNASRPCGAYPPSDSPEGVHDLNGNAMEWSAGSLAEPPAARRTAAHGAPAVRARSRTLYALNAAWLRIEPGTRSHHLGFRCAYDAPPPEERPWGGRAAPRARIEGGEFPIGLPPGVRLARLALILPDSRLRDARTLLASSRSGPRRIAIGRCEVSREEYAAFLDDPLARAGLFANRQEPEGEDYAPADWERQLEDPGLPVAGMSWWAADAFARWAGGRLPRLEEWQLTAAGPAARVYPWGNRYDPEAAVTGDLPEPGPRGCLDGGGRDESAAGVLHLAGNVSEWTQSIAVEGGNYAMWVQGGNWILPGRETARTSFGRLVPLNHRSRGIGLRVVYE